MDWALPLLLLLAPPSLVTNGYKKSGGQACPLHADGTSINALMAVVSGLAEWINESSDQGDDVAVVQY